MGRQVLSVIPYYGGKAKMNDLIVDLLDYENTDIYIEPFGGGARTLLNKPRHKVECMNDLSTGIRALFTVLTKEDTTKQLMDFLYKTHYSIEWFNWALDYRNSIEDNAFGEIKRQMLAFIKKISPSLFEDFKKYKDSSYIENAIKELKISPDDKKRAKILLTKYLAIKGNKNLHELKFNEAFNEKDYNIIEHAAATFIVYQMSRDAMGKYFSKHRFKNDDAYYSRVDNLLEASHRLRGVEITSYDAFDFFNEDEDTILNNSRVMVYCDPTYLSEADVESYIKTRQDYNPGKVYKNYWTYTEHELFLQKIQMTKCKILVSNYRDRTRLYDRYLNSEYGWKSIEYNTYTTINGRASARTEVLWYNY